MSEGDQRAVCEAAHAQRMARRGFAWGGFHFDGGVSAGKVLFFDRPAAVALWKQTGDGDVVIVAKQDRLVRRVYDWAQVVHQFQRRGVLLAIENMGTSDGEVVRMDPFNPFNKAMLGMAAVFGELELDQICERNRMRVKRCQAVGRMFSGQASYGYRGVEIGAGKYLVPDVHQRQIAHWLCAMQDAGHKVQAIADELNARGHRIDSAKPQWRGDVPRYTPVGHYARSTVSERMSAERALRRAEVAAGVDWVKVVYIPGPGAVRMDSLDPKRQGLYREAGVVLAAAESRRLLAAGTAIAIAGQTG